MTGGFEIRKQAADAVASGATYVVRLARAMELDPQLAETWLTDGGGDPVFPEFEPAPPGGITAWYTLWLTTVAEGREGFFVPDLPSVIRAYEDRDALRCKTDGQTKIGCCR